ncbi:juvenile hormone esterase [Penaeus vannamei]|uniref:juvenile hormone esterase n=1 Tax=Penaeus vannamei TaxID=6689 RepID=UPI00387FA82B
MLPVLVAMAVLAPAGVAGGDAAPVVAVAGGRVAGATETSTKGREFHAYYGVPFARPPLGELRLKDPVTAESWEGVRDGSKKPSPCLLVPFGATVMGITLTPEELHGDEDCLYLNVFMPKRDEPAERLPVMVWIHGGGFFAGGAHEYLPHVLMNHDIVLVVVQYRLGILGFLSTEDEVMPGNFGMKDQVMALHWVQENIHSFGGDADRVTIFGESAGGASVHLHMLSPMSKGLFSGVIMQSGSALAPWAHREEFRSVAEEVSRSVGCGKGLGSQGILACLQQKDGRKLAASFQDFLKWFILPLVTAPRVDGDFLPDDPARLMRDGDVHRVNLMAGITRDDGAIVTQPLIFREDQLDVLRENFSVVGPISMMEPMVPDPIEFCTRIYQHYLGDLTFDLDRMEDLTRLYTDYTFGIPHDLTTLTHARVPGVATYRYELKHRAELSFGDFCETDKGRHWIPHADDLFYLFAGGPLLAPDHLAGRPSDLRRQDDLRLRDIITTLWTNFAATGNPTPDDALGFKWEAATEDDLRYLALTPSPAMEADQRQEVRDFHASLPTKMNQILHPDRVISGKKSSHSSQDEL